MQDRKRVNGPFCGIILNFQKIDFSGEGNTVLHQAQKQVAHLPSGTDTPKMGHTSAVGIFLGETWILIPAKAVIHAFV